MAVPPRLPLQRSVPVAMRGLALLIALCMQGAIPAQPQGLPDGAFIASPTRVLEALATPPEALATPPEALARTPGARTAADPLHTLIALAGEGDAESGIPDPAPHEVLVPPPAAAEPGSVYLAQTHVLPPEGRRWTVRDWPDARRDIEVSQHFTALRQTLLMVRVPGAPAENEGNLPVASGRALLQVEASRGGVMLGSMPLQPPHELPPTEGRGAPFPPGFHSALLPADWMRPGLELQVVRHTGGSVTRFPGLIRPRIGADTHLTLQVLPIQLFDQRPTDPTLPTREPTFLPELYARLPVARLSVRPHPLQGISWPYVVLPPEADAAGRGQPARRIEAAPLREDGRSGPRFQREIMGALLPILQGIRSASGEADQPVLVYSPVLMRNAQGRPTTSGGGLALNGAGVSAGDNLYGHVFLHELGHTMGLTHQGDAAASGAYPYQRGSLAGSAWGYDLARRWLLPPTIPPTAPNARRCVQLQRVTDPRGQCYRQDIMQGGQGDQAAGLRFPPFSDFSTGQMQAWLESRLAPDPRRPGDLRQWDGGKLAWQTVEERTVRRGVFGLDSGLAVRTDRPVATIVVTVSRAGTAGATQIYPLLWQERGTHVQHFNPTRPDDRRAITPGTGRWPHYCIAGCDYTLELEETGGRRQHVVLQGGFRPWGQPEATERSNTRQAGDPESFRTWVVNVPTDQALRAVRLLHTPMVWKGWQRPLVAIAERRVDPNLDARRARPLPLATRDFPALPGE